MLKCFVWKLWTYVPNLPILNHCGGGGAPMGPHPLPIRARLQILQSCCRSMKFCICLKIIRVQFQIRLHFLDTQYSLVKIFQCCKSSLLNAPIHCTTVLDTIQQVQTLQGAHYFKHRHTRLHNNFKITPNMRRDDILHHLQSGVKYESRSNKIKLGHY